MVNKVQSAVLKHRARPWPPRRVAFVDVVSGVFLHENGSRAQIDGAVSVEGVLEVAAAAGWGSEVPQIVYIVGCWNAASTPETQWFASLGQWQRTTYHRGPLIVVYKHRETGRKLTFYGTSQWFGDCGNIELCQRAYVRLRLLLRGVFGNTVDLLGTPARTGLDLIERSLPVEKDGTPYEWPVLDEQFRGTIEQHIGQGRMEMLQQSEKTPQVQELYILDAIWMYASCVRRLPSPPLSYDQIEAFDQQYRAGFYHVQFQVPQGWDHIGLLPVWHPRLKRFVWPWKPGGFWYDAYVCAEELRLAQEQKWPFKILERWLFAAGDNPAQDPLKNWIEKLRMLRDRAGDTKTEGELAGLLSKAIRSLTIKAIGGLHRKGRYQQKEAPVEQAHIPEDGEILWRTETVIRWKEPISLDQSMLHFAQPHLAACVWGRARAKLAKAALLLPRSCIIALRSDSVVVTFDPSKLTDSEQAKFWQGTRPGEFRMKQRLELAPGQALPKTSREYLDLL